MHSEVFIFDKSEVKFDFEIICVHINHQIREEANDDELFVQYYCKKNQIKFYAKRIDVIKYANNNKIGLEEAGRIARYKYFDEPLQTSSLDKELDLEWLKNMYGNEFHVPIINLELRKAHELEREKYAMMGIDFIERPDDTISVIGLFGCHKSKSKLIMKKFLHDIKTIPNILPERPRLIDFLKWILTVDHYGIKPLHPYANAYIESYEKQQFIEDEEEIVNLRNQLEDLLKVRDQLSEQIEDLKRLINLETSKKTGGIKP